MSQEKSIEYGTGSLWIMHSATAEDKAAMAALRVVAEPNKGKMRGPEARGAFDAIMSRVAPAVGVTYQADTVGGVPGRWCKPEKAQIGVAVLHLHGGWFNWGKADIFRNLVSHLAVAANVEAFVPEYRLAPEHPFPAAFDDAFACYRGLIECGFRRIAVSGDSAGGNLALGLAARLVGSGEAAAPVGVVALSPVTDLTLSGQSWETRAAADPYFVKPQAKSLVEAYLAGHSATDPRVSPLFGELAGLPSVRIYAGDDEVLLDDSRRYIERASAAGVDAKGEVWEGMPHGFVGGVGRFAAASQAWSAIGSFLIDRLNSSH